METPESMPPSAIELKVLKDADSDSVDESRQALSGFDDGVGDIKVNDKEKGGKVSEYAQWMDKGNGEQCLCIMNRTIPCDSTII